MNTINPVVDYLYIGNIDALHPEIIQRHNIQAIVSVIGHDIKIMYPANTNFIKIGIWDNEAENIEPWLEPGFQFIHSHRLTKKNVLVHCQAGISRSATMVLYYLMKCFGVPLRVAFGHLREKRPSVNPNTRFMRTLSKYSMQRFGGI